MNTLLDHPVINQRYFFPRKTPLKNALRIQTGAAKLACYYHCPHPGARTVLHYHGNGEVVSDYIGPYLESFGVLGLNCLLVEYRGYGESTGEPALAAMLDDVAPVVRSLDLPQEKLIFFGRSIGSIYAIHGASLFPDIAGLIIESGIANVKERLLLRVTPEELDCSLSDLERECKKYLDHEAKLKAFKKPVLVMHARYDGLVELWHAERNHQWSGGPKTLKIFEKGNHNTVITVNPVEYFQTIQSFVESLDHGK